MSYPIRITAGDVEVSAELNDSSTAATILEVLPIVGSGNLWGEEIYFEIPVDQPLAPDATEDVEIGDLGYWPPGKAFCLFFGRTPASTSDKPKAASAVNVVGRISGDPKALLAIPHGAEVRIEQA